MGILLGVFGLVISIGIMILLIISWWIIYDKMGEKGWKCLVPFYGRYVLFREVWESKIYFISFAFKAISCVVNGWIAFQSYQNLLMYDNLELGAGSVGIIIFSFIFFFIDFAIQMMLNWRLVKCFGKGVAFFLGLLFFPIIFIPVLAFGTSYFDYY